ncbi:MAG: formate dehydrogenase accessory protein FdhE [Firmicutes bacterium]|nr:formate dehydrogenase accessory protein FdhE [Bacillota bacterium]
MTELNNIIEGAFNLFAELLALQESYLPKISHFQPSLSQEEVERRLGQGENLLSFYLPLVDLCLCSELQQEICRLVSKHRPEKNFELEKIGAYLAAHPRVYEDFLKQNRSFSPPADLREETELLDFIVYQTMRPFLQKFALQARSLIQDEQWMRDYCPVCGEKPLLSYLRREDGKRVLVCPLCATEWCYRYLVCTWCGNEEHRSFRYFEVAEITGYEVYVCEKCRGYLKTYNEKKGTGHDDWVLEDVRTLLLDMIAFREGFTRPGGKILQ